MKLALLGLAGLVLWLVLRRRGDEGERVLVAWKDGSELELRPGGPDRERLRAIAQRVLP